MHRFPLNAALIKQEWMELLKQSGVQTLYHYMEMGIPLADNQPGIKATVYEFYSNPGRSHSPLRC